MNNNDNFALVPRPPAALEKAEPGAKRILAGMVADTLALISRADADVQYQKGCACADGNGVPQDYVAAARFFREAAAKGHAEAQYILGGMYFHGLGLSKDFSQAVMWYREAAKQNHAGAQFALGNRFKDGIGVGVDLVEAYKWFRLAADHDKAAADEQVQSTGSFASLEADSTLALLSSEEFDEADQRVRAFRASRGVSSSQSEQGQPSPNERGDLAEILPKTFLDAAMLSGEQAEQLKKQAYARAEACCRLLRAEFYGRETKRREETQRLKEFFEGHARSHAWSDALLQSAIATRNIMEGVVVQAATKRKLKT